EPSAEFQEWAAAGQAMLLRRRFRAEDLAGMRLAVGASDLLAENRALAQAARARGLPVNVVDQPALSTAYMPALVDRDPVLVAISTEGTAPVLARRLRAAIEQLLPQRLGAVATLAERWRPRLRSALPEASDRRRFWEGF